MRRLAFSCARHPKAKTASQQGRWGCLDTRDITFGRPTVSFSKTTFRTCAFGHSVGYVCSLHAGLLTNWRHGVFPNQNLDIVPYGCAEGCCAPIGGGVLNGLLKIAIAWAFPFCALTPSRLALYGKCFVFIGWANTLFS